MRALFAALIAVSLLIGCSRGGNNERWDMDPRLADMAESAWACVADVTGANPEFGPPPFKGVDNSWDGGAIGQWWEHPRRIQVQITLGDSWVRSIAFHELAEIAHQILKGWPGGESHANQVDNECKELVRQGVYPAPPIDWGAVN